MVFSEYKESHVVTEVKFKFMHLYTNGYRDWPKSRVKQKAYDEAEVEDEEEQDTVSAKYVFLGPCRPSAPTRSGFRFEQDEEAKKKYWVVKNNLKSLLSV